jgi:hypothetical protein
MTDILKAEKKSVHPLAAGVTGIMLGAAGAAAIALSDEETRKRAAKKAKQLSSDLQKWGSHRLENMKNKKESAQQIMSEEKDTIAEEMKETEL